MEEMNTLRIFNKLKSVYRFNSVDARKESSAEHSWASLILADFFLTKTSQSIDRLKVYELLMYHDVVEIEIGDTPMIPGSSNKDGQYERETAAAGILAAKLPDALQKKYTDLFGEFQEQETIESRFAKAIDQLEAQIHELDYKEDWKGWTEDYLVSNKAKYFEEFPEMLKMFNTLVGYLRSENYFDK